MEDRATERLLQPKSRVEQYQVIRLLGEGGMGEVYLARDTRLGRKVALKIVRREVLGNEENRERFLHEARVTARFNHPHIVTLYGVGEHQGCPYVALEYLEGQNLWERMNEERPGVRESLRIGLAIAEALREAHAHNVLHRDLKPRNIAMPTDGRLRVLDFGLAKLVTGDEAALSQARQAAPAPTEPADAEDPDAPSFQTQVNAIRGTPHYMAPEQWRQESSTPATDIWALGVILFELLTGAHPHKGATFIELCMRVSGPGPSPSITDAVGDLPESITALVDRCLDKDPEKRPTAADVVEILGAELHEEGQHRTVDVSPFRGLLPFAEQHAALYYGRDTEIATCLERLRTEPILPVVGPSGSGKSSFVQAGVIPRLREHGNWRILRLRPGPRPLEALAAQLAAVGGSSITVSSSPVSSAGSRAPAGSGDGHAVDPTGQPTSRQAEAHRLDLELRDTPSRLALLLGQLAERERCRVLLFVDQLEELYTLTPDEEERAAFLKAVCSAADDPSGPIRVIFTVRDDFLWRLAEGEESRWLTRVLVLRALGAGALLETLQRPVAALGYRWEDKALPAEMVNAILDEPAALPLLQFAAQQVWEQRDRAKRCLPRSAYESVGGVAGALAQHADAVLAGLSAAQVRIAREIFTRLVTPEGTRQVASREKVLEGLGPEAASVLERLTASRAILVRKGRVESELELIHESLIQRWQRLRRWLAESREERAFLEEVGQAAELWEKRGRPADEVWRGRALAVALLRAADCRAVGELPRAFLDASSRRERRRQRLQRALGISAFALLLLIALAAVAVSLVVTEQKQEANRQRRTAQRQRHRALRERAAALQESARSALARGALLEARAKVRLALETRDSPLVRGLWWQLRNRRLHWNKQLGAILYDVAFSPDGLRVAVACQDRAVHLYDVRTGASTVLRGHRDQVFSVAFSPDGRSVAAGSWGGRILTWQLDTGRVLPLDGHKNAVRGLQYSPDGQTLVSASDDQTMRIWNARTGASIAVLRGHRSSVRSLSIRSDGRMLAALERNGRLGLWRLPRGAAPRFLQAHEGGAMAVRFSPDGSTVATAGDDRTVKIWDVAGGRLVRTLSGSATTLSFSRDGRLLATAGEDRNVWLWDPLSGQVRAVLRGHQKSVRGVQLGPRGRLLASVSADKTLRLWRLSAVASGRRVDGHAAQVNGVSFSPDGRLLATASYDQTVRLWDVSSGRTIRVLRGHRGTVGEASFSPDGKLLATAGNDRTIQLWEVKTGRGRRILHGHQGAVWSVAFHPRGQLLASTSYDGTVRLWEVDTGTPRATLRGHRGMVLGVTFSPDGTLLASSGSDRTIRLWDAATAKLKAVLTEPTSSVRGASFSPDGRRLLSTGSAHSVRLWDLAAKTSRFVRAFPGRVYWLTFHPDGRRIGIPTSEGLGRICPLGAGRCVTLRGHQSEVNYLRFSPKGRLAATTSDDQTVRLWNAESGRPLWRAPLLGRKSGELFTHRGWHRLEGVGNRPALFTPTGTKWRRAVAERARYAEESDRGDLLCLQTHDGALEAWNTAKDRLLYQTALPGLDRILALADRCVSLAAGTLRLHAADGRQTPLEKGVTGVTWDRGQLLVSDARQLTVRSPSGTVRARHRNGGGATAIARVGNHLVLGFADGALERIQADAASEPSGSFFEHLPASPVLRIIAGPTGTVVAGYGNGQVGVWSLKHGTRLAHARLHGPVFHLLLRGHRLHAASDLGQHTTLDLTPYFTPFCQLLRQVWRAAPAVWRDDAPRLAPPPPSHRCAAGR